MNVLFGTTNNMKKFILGLGFVLSSVFGFGQFIQGRLVFSPMVGMQDVSKLLNTNNFEDDKTYTLSGSYVPNFNAEYGINNVVSIGIGVAYQEVQIVDEDYVYYDSKTTMDVHQPLTVDYTRIEPGLRGYVHFIDHSHLDLYSGFKLGYAFWSKPTITSDDPVVFNEPYEKLKGRNLNFQTFFGFRCYFARYYGIHVEAGLVAPYQLAVGLNYRIFTKHALKHQPKGNPIKSRDQVWYRLFKRY